MNCLSFFFFSFKKKDLLFCELDSIVCFHECESRLWVALYLFSVVIVLITSFLLMKDNFQQWISWLLHRWRTQRNAIRNVNCRSVTHRNFERTLHLVVFRQVCLFECLCTLSFSLFFFLGRFFILLLGSLLSEKKRKKKKSPLKRKKERILVSLRKRIDFEYLRHAFLTERFYWS